MPLSEHQTTRSGMLKPALLTSQGRTLRPYQPCQPYPRVRVPGGRVPQHRRESECLYPRPRARRRRALFHLIHCL